MRLSKRLGACITMLMPAFLATPLNAQQSVAPSASSSDDVQLTEIVVTAQRREERLQDVPVAVTALTAPQLQKLQITNVQSLPAAAPGLTTSASTGDPSDLQIAIRGANSNDAEPTIDTAVGIYMNGVYYARTVGSNFGLLDLQDVEVLRGPQGTLFGRNTIGGAITIATHEPVDSFGGSVQVDAGNFDTRNVIAILNLPIAPGILDARFVVAHEEHDGYGRDVFLGEPLSDQHTDYARSSFKFTPADNVELLVVADDGRNYGHASMAKFSYVGPDSLFRAIPPAAAALAAIPTNFYDNAAGIDPRNDQNEYGGSATLTVKGDLVNFKSISGFRHTDRDDPISLDGTPFPLLQLGQTTSYRQYSQELQLYGRALDRLDWIGGLYYFEEYGTNNIASAVLAPAVNLELPHYENQSRSAFLQTTYAIMPELKVTAGARYVSDTRSVQYREQTQEGACAFDPAITLSPVYNAAECLLAPEGVRFHYIPWTAGLDFTAAQDLLLYFKVSQGYRSGGFPASGANNLETFAPFQPESLLQYEVGEKTELLNHTLRLNTAAFYSNYKDIQQNNNGYDPVTGEAFQTIQNVGAARIYGGEFEVSWLVNRTMLNAGLALMDPEYTRGPFTGNSSPRNSPHTTFNVSGDNPFDTEIGRFNMHVDANWRSRVTFQEPGTLATGGVATDEAITQGSYGLLNAVLSFDPKAAPLTLSLWGKNLTGKQYDLNALGVGAPLFIVSTQQGYPRTYGASAQYHFGKSE